MQQASHDDQQNFIFDSRHLSVSQGLLVLRAAEAISQGMGFADIKKNLPLWRDGTWIFTDIHSLNYLVKGGRISPLKGKIAKALNLKPIVTVDDQGKGAAIGKSFSRSANMKKIIKMTKAKASEGKLWNYAIVHAECSDRAETYARKLTALLGKEPLYITEIGPVVGVHNGPGACAVGMLIEKE
jgi:DegV family protein with EDD domain